MPVVTPLWYSARVINKQNVVTLLDEARKSQRLIGLTSVMKSRTAAESVVQVAMTLVGNVSLLGAEIRIYDLDAPSASFYGTELAGTESHTAATFTFYAAIGNSLAAQVLLDGYEEAVARITMPSVASTYPITLAVDRNA